MRSRPFRIWMWSSIFVFPPLGFVLMVMRSDWSKLRRFATTFLIAIIAVVELWFGILHLRIHERLGIHMEWNGDFTSFFFNRESRAEHAARLERDREKQRALPPIATAPGPEPAPVAAASSTSAESAPAKVQAATPTPAKFYYWTDFRGPKREGAISQVEI